LIRCLPAAALAAWCAAWCAPAAARTLDVGLGATYASPSDAAAVAADGDTVLIAPGIYFDCAIWRANGLMIAGAGPDVQITDKPCAGKAAFVVHGDGVTIRGLSFMRIRVPDGNGAGIRSEGRDLTVEDSRFINNQVGILAGGQSGGSLRISGSSFTATGTGPQDRPMNAVMAGPLDLLRVSHSMFEAARSGGHIASAALHTELIGNQLSDEGGRMTGPLVSIAGGSILLDGNSVDLASDAADRPGAVLVFGDAAAVRVSGNTLIEPMGSVPLVRNWSGTSAIEEGNVVPPGAAAVSEEGAAYHRLRSRIASLRTVARGLAGAARHDAAEVARGLKLIP
jgi:hypothetical protein